MSNRYFSLGAERSANVRSLFSAIARRYDLINDLQSAGLHRWWKRRALTCARVRSGERVLDLCCGTGDLAQRLASRGARVVGTDFSWPMLNRARARRAPASRDAAAVSEANWVQADALHLPFIGASFDLVTLAYGLRNLAGMERGLRECLRVTKPGGRLVILDFGKPPNPLLRWCFFQYLRRIVPWIGRGVCGDREAYGYILESLTHYPAQKGVFEALQRLQFTGVELRNCAGGLMSIHYAKKPL